MKEKEIRDLVIEKLNKEGWYCWWPAKVKFRQSDICGVFDLFAMRGRSMKLVQYTTKSHLSHRRNKIKQFFAENKIKINFAFVYAYDEKNKRFVIEKIK